MKITLIQRTYFMLICIIMFIGLLKAGDGHEQASVLNLPYEMQLQNFEYLIANVQTGKQLREAVESYPQVHTQFNQFIQSGIVNRLIQQKKIDILQHAQKELEAWASMIGDIRVPNLLYYGIDAVDAQGNTALNLILKKIYENRGFLLVPYDLINLLLDDEIDINKGDKRGVTPLMRAAALGDVDVAQELIIRGAHINTIDEENNSALSYAVSNSETAIVQLLLHFKAIITPQVRQIAQLKKHRSPDAQIIATMLGV